MIYLVRHGQTEFNRAGRFQGALDSPLTALGEAQAAAMGRRLAELADPDTPIVSSPLGRARATAELIRATGGFRGEIALDARLAEVSMGEWDGLTWAELVASGPGFPVDAPPPDWYMRSPDGESFDALAARLGDWLDEVRGLPTPLIAVSHGVSTRVLRGLYDGRGRDAALREPVPQDACFRLEAGRIEQIDCQLAPQP